MSTKGGDSIIYDDYHYAEDTYPPAPPETEPQLRPLDSRDTGPPSTYSYNEGLYLPPSLAHSARDTEFQPAEPVPALYSGEVHDAQDDEDMYYAKHDSPDERVCYKDAEPRDLLFAVIFIVHLVTMSIIAIVAFANAGSANQRDESVDYSVTRKIVLVCSLVAMIAGFFSYGWITLLKTYSKEVIIGTIAASILFWIGLGIMFLALGAIGGGIIFILIGMLYAFFFYSWRKRIPFSSVMLSTIARICADFPSSTYVAYASIPLTILWLVVWLFAVILVQQFDDSYLLTVFLILSFYWTTQVIKNVVHVTASGLFASWYFLSPNIPADPTLASFKRATTTSFGSICLGSLLVSLVKTLRWMAKAARNNRDMNLVQVVIGCILSVLDSLIRYFNKYAFVQVAIYGKSYCHAARDTWQLVKSHGIDAIINDNIISGVLLMGSVLGGVISAMAGGILGVLIVPAYWVLCALLSFFVGLVVVANAMEVVDSGVATIFVCFAEDPQILSRVDGQLAEQFLITYGQQLGFA